MGGFYIGKCPRIVPFLENNRPRPLAGPRSIIFKEWSDTRTFSYTSHISIWQLWSVEYDVAVGCRSNQKKVGFFSVNIVAKLYEGDEDDDE